MAASNYKMVDNTGGEATGELFFPVMLQAYQDKCLQADHQDIFKVEFLEKCNPDGTDRMIISWA